MNHGTIRAGTFFGVELRFHFTWPILCALIAWTFIYGVLPTAFPALSTAQNLVTGLAATALLFLSVIIHEYAHAIYAKRTGLKVERITMFLFGGAAELQEEPKKPGQEFIMAGLGPLTSFVLSIIFGLVGMAGLAIGSLPLLALGAVLASANFLLAIFNLIPGFPLDGGRIFRAAAWKVSGSMLTATKIASFGGKTFAILLLGLGVFLLIGGGLNGAWYILLGYFLYQAASASLEQTRLSLLLQGVQVGDMIKSQSLLGWGRAAVGEFIKKYVSLGRIAPSRAYTPSNITTQIVTNEYIKNADYQLFHQTPQNAANPETILHLKDPAMRALSLLQDSGQRLLPVVDDGQIVGTLSIENIQNYIVGTKKLKPMN